MSLLSIAIVLLVVYFGGVITGALVVIGLGIWISAEIPQITEDVIAAETPRGD